MLFRILACLQSKTWYALGKLTVGNMHPRVICFFVIDLHFDVPAFEFKVL